MTKTYNITISDAWDTKISELASTNEEKLLFFFTAIKAKYINTKVAQINSVDRVEIVSAEATAAADLAALKEERTTAINNLIREWDELPREDTQISE